MSKAVNYHDKAVNMGHWFQCPNQALKAMFGRIEHGYSREERTYFYRGWALDDVLNLWKDKLESIKTEWPGLWEFESDMADKVGPMSIMKPLSERMDDIDAYYSGITLPSQPIHPKALELTINEWNKIRGLEPRSQERTVDLMKKSTNSGSPYYKRKRDVVGRTIPCKVYPDIYQGYPSAIQVLQGHEWNACAVLGWRGQEGGRSIDDIKQRVVWMYPFALNIRELQVYQPLIEGAQRYNINPAWVSMEAVDQRITQLFRTKGNKDIILCTDFTKFDQSFNEQMQYAAYSILLSLLNGSAAANDWLDNVFPLKYSIPLCYKEGIIRFGKHGMGSGSGGTNADETLAHRSLQHEAAILQGQELNLNSMCLGDDGIVSFPRLNVERLLDAYTSHGLEMNPAKQSASTDECIYLRRWHHIKYRVNDICVGVYATCRALGRLLESERSLYGFDRKMTALRQLSILENCKYHPLRDEFADFCMKGDRYRLGLDIPGFLDELPQYVQEVTAYMPDFLGYTKSQQSDATADPTYGIANWWIVQYLKSKA